MHTFVGDAHLDYFGFSADGAGDLDADGYSDVVVGAFRGGANSGGYARVFSGRLGSEIHSFHGETVGDLFGMTVKSLGDVNRDGSPDIAVGAVGWDDPVADTKFNGRLYIYSGSTGELIHGIQGASGMTQN